MKPNTYTKLYVHCIFTPKGRYSMLSDSIRPKVHKYIYGIIVKKNCYPVAINGTKDHIHLLIGFPPVIAISDLVRDIKRSSAMFINNHINSSVKFNWQEGFGGFTIGYKELDSVYHYIQNQEEHHRLKSFPDEYMNLLIEHEVDYNPDFLPEFYE